MASKSTAKKNSNKEASQHSKQLIEEVAEETYEAAGGILLCPVEDFNARVKDYAKLYGSKEDYDDQEFEEQLLDCVDQDKGKKDDKRIAHFAMQAVQELRTRG